MTVASKVTATVSVLAAAGFAGPVPAQDGGVSGDEARDFVESMVEEAREIVAEGNWSAMQGWIEGNFAEESRVAAQGSLITTGGPIVSYEIVADREDLARFGGMMFAGPHEMGEVIEDFSLTGEVQSVETLPNGEALAIVRFAEWGMLDFSGVEGGGAEVEPIAFHSAAFCDLRLSRSEGEVRIAVAACQVTTTM